jgi:hypothetical protein
VSLGIFFVGKEIWIKGCLILSGFSKQVSCSWFCGFLLGFGPSGGLLQATTVLGLRIFASGSYAFNCILI